MDGGWFVELGVWVLTLLVAGYVLLFCAAFRLFASASNRKSALGAALLLALIALALFPVYWLAVQ